MKKLTLAALGGAVGATLLMGVLAMATPAGAQESDEPARDGIDAPFERFGHHRFGGMRGPGGFHALDTAAGVIGIEVEDLREALSDGETSLADVAEANGVDPQAVIDALVAEKTERIDAAVEAGFMDAERAEELTSSIAERVEHRVNTAGPGCMKGGPPEGGEADTTSLAA